MTLYIRTAAESGVAYVATIERLSDSTFREDDAEVFSSGLAFTDKDIALIEGSAQNRGKYVRQLDASGWSDGLYNLNIHDPNQSNSVIGSKIFAVRGGIEVPVGEQNYIYHADIQYISAGAESESEYTVTWFRNGARITSGITSPTIQVYKRSDGTDLIASSAMTQIGSIGSYKYDSATLQDVGESYVVVARATIDGSQREFARVQGRDSSA